MLRHCSRKIKQLGILSQRIDTFGKPQWIVAEEYLDAGYLTQTLKHIQRGQGFGFIYNQLLVTLQGLTYLKRVRAAEWTTSGSVSCCFALNFRYFGCVRRAPLGFFEVCDERILACRCARVRFVSGFRVLWFCGFCELRFRARCVIRNPGE